MAYTIRTKDGIVINNIPDDVAPDSDVLKQRVADLRASRQAGPKAAVDTAPQAPVEPEEESSLQSFVEPALAIGSSIVAEPAAGIAGLFQILNPWAEEGAGARAVEATREALTFQPRTEVGKRTVAEVGGVLAPVGEAAESVSKGLGDTVLDLTGSPELATMAFSAPTALVELLGLKGLQAMKPGTRLLDKAGRPTKTLRRELNKRGLDFDNLSPEIQKVVPETVEPGRLPGANKAAEEAEGLIKKQLETGSKDDALAGLKIDEGRVVADSAATKAIKQGFEPGMVQTIKTATPATRNRMLNMARRMRRIKKQARLGAEIRPSDVVGDAVSKRVEFIRDQANTARKELNQIASKNLPGKKVDGAPVLDTLEASLGDLDVRLIEDKAGNIIPEFKGSLISKDTTSQKVITDLVDLLMEPVQPDALRFHKLKRQIDNMVDFNKKSAAGLTGAGEKVLKQVRHQLNQSIRAVDPDYARVNDVLAESLQTLDGLDDAVGSIDIFGPGANKALGTRMRALLSNQQGRVKIENALDQINDTATNLGATFTDDVKDLILFSDALDARFGTVAKTSLAGQVEQATRQALTQAPSTTVVGKAAEVAGKGVEKLRGINDFNAFESLEMLLSEGGK